MTKNRKIKNYDIISFNNIRVNILHNKLNKNKSYILANAFNSDNVSLGVLHDIILKNNESSISSYIAALKKLYKIDGKLPSKLAPSSKCIRILEKDLIESINENINEKDFNSRREYLNKLIISRFNKYIF